MAKISEMEVREWAEFEAQVDARRNGGWVWRGQDGPPKPLQTTLERACRRWGVPLEQAAKMENGLLREFRRRYDRSDVSLVRSDRLYCLAMMRHHGAPARLLDFTYSPFIASYFALKTHTLPSETTESSVAVDEGMVWGIRGDWLLKIAGEIVGTERLTQRNVDTTRSDASFNDLYSSTDPVRFVFSENPLFLARLLPFFPRLSRRSEGVQQYGAGRAG